MGKPALKSFAELATANVKTVDKPMKNEPGYKDYITAQHGPLVAATESALEETVFTHDLPLLERKQYHAVFVYGNLKSKHPDRHILGEGDEVFSGEGFTKYGTYAMYVDKKGDATYPIMISRPFSKFCAPIKGEVYIVPTHRMITLDEYFTNGLRFKRVLMDIKLPYTLTESGKGISDTTTVKAWCWVANGKEFNPLIKGSSTIKLKELIAHRKNGDAYYWFSKADYGI